MTASKLPRLAYWPWGVLLLALVAVAVTGVFLFRSSIPAGPDVAMHVFNAQQFAKQIQSGVLYPRWLGDWYGGYGAALGVAYPPLTYYLVSLFSFVGISIVAAYKILFFLTVFVSGLVMRQLAVRFMNPLGALVAALVYQIAPYRIIDLYVRGAFPEFIAFMWLPIIALLTLYWVQKRHVLYGVALALAIAALALTHLQVAYLFGIAMLPFWIYVVFRSDVDWKWAMVRLAVAAGLGLALAAVYWLPASQESSYMNTAFLQNLQPGQLPKNQEWANYLNNFMFNAQIYQSTELNDFYVEINEVSIGAVFFILIGLCALGINLYDWKNRSAAMREMSLVMIGTLGISTFMFTSFSRPLYAIIPRASTIQFPMRWQTVTSLAAAYLAGEAISWAYTRYSTRIAAQPPVSWALPAFLVGILAVTAAFSGYIIRSQRSQIGLDVIDQFVGKQPLSPDNFAWVFDGFYLPPSALDFDYITAIRQNTPLITSDAPVETNIQNWGSEQRAFTVSSSQDSTIDVRTFWFPGWQATVNGQVTPIDVHPGDGTISLHVPAGTSAIKLAFENTAVRTLGLVLSAIALLVLLGLTLFGLTNRKSIA